MFSVRGAISQAIKPRSPSYGIFSQSGAVPSLILQDCMYVCRPGEVLNIARIEKLLKERGLRQPMIGFMGKYQIAAESGHSNVVGVSQVVQRRPKTFSKNDVR